MMGYNKNIHIDILKDFVILSKKYGAFESGDGQLYRGMDIKYVYEIVLKTLLDLENKLEKETNRLKENSEVHNFDVKTIIEYSRKIGETTFATPYYEKSWLFSRARPPIPQEDVMTFSGEKENF